MSESQKYKVQVFSAVGIRTVNPIGIAEVRETFTRKDDSRFEMEAALDGKVTYTCDDYQYFQTQADSERRYDEVRAVISIWCGGAWVVKWRTFIDVMKGTFDRELKTFTSSFTLEGPNRDFEANKSTEFNILDIVSARIQSTATYTAGLVFANGVPLYAALLAILREILAVTSVKSDFFKWNPTNPSYTIGNNTKLQNQGLFHKSDIVKASMAGYAPATIMTLSLERLVNNLCNLYNMKYTLDAAGNFRIEHVSWFTHGSGLDLTLSRYAEYLKGTREFSFNEPKIFRLEEFKNPGSINTDFVGLPIEYRNEFIRSLRSGPERFTTEREKDDVLTREVDFITDIDAIYGNIGSQVSATPNRDEDLDGIVLLALDASNNLQLVNNILGPSPTSVPKHYNNVNAWAQLQRDYWKVGRLFPQGIMNKTVTAFTDVQKIKRRKRISIPFCCNENLDPNGIFVTEYGNAIANKISVDYYRGRLELDLLYEDLGTVTLSAPNAIDDIYATNFSTTLNTSSAGKPSVLANDTGATTVVPESKSTLLGGTVNILANGHFIYNPPAGISGSDLFTYVALNVAGRADSANVKIIIKVGTVYVHLVIRQSVYVFFPVTGSPPNGLYRKYAEFQYFEDPLLQVPLDLTNYGITINYSQRLNSVTTSGSFLASGTFNTIQGGSGSNALPTYTATITPSSAYTII